MAFFYRALSSINKKLNGSLYDDFQVEINDDENPRNLITKNGGYMTVIDFKGAFSVMDGKAMDDFVEELIMRLRGDLKQPGRLLEFCLMHNPDFSSITVSKNIDPIMDTAKRLKISAGTLFDEKRQILSDQASYYSSYLVVTTNPKVLGGALGDVTGRDLATKKEKRRIVRLGEHTPGPGVGISEVGDAHNAFIKSLAGALDGNINFELLGAKDAMLRMKQMMFLESTSDNWRPSLPGDKIRINSKRSTPVASDLSDVMNPSIATQFFDISPTRDRDNGSLVDIDGYKYAPVLVEYGPESSEMFSVLAKNLKGEIPYRINITIRTGHDDVKKSLVSKNALGSYLTLFNSNNSVIKQSVNALISMAEEHTLCDMSIAACTWGEDSESCVRNKRMLMQALSNWGGLSSIEERGDPIGILAESVGGLIGDDGRQSPRFPMPIFEALSMCPFAMPSSSWKTGSFLFMTPFNSIYPLEMGSSLQTSWLNLISAPPGYGKSFLMAAMNLSNILKPGIKSLPVLSILDIGYSSAVFVRLIRSMLPENQKHLAQSYKLQNTKEYAINIFDTMLGCRQPTSLERHQIEDLLVELLSPSDGAAFEGLTEIVKLMVEKVYALKADQGEPNEYGPGQAPLVTEALERHGIEAFDGITWFQVEDALSEVGDYRAAKIAHRYAVPRLSDLASVLSDNAFDDYKTAVVNGHGMMERVRIAIKAATRDYTLLSSITQFEISDARIISLDLQDVVPRSDGGSSKQANVMYMLGKLVTTKSFYMGSEALKEVNPKYRDYHAKVFDELDSVQKYLCVDEYHRTKSSNIFRSGLIRDAREGRKFGIIITVISQYDTDFDDDLVKASTNKFILSVGDDGEDRERIGKRFSISRAAMEQAKVACHGPKKGEGSNILYIGKIKGKGTVQQVLRYVGGVRESWAFTTNKKDDRLINKMIDKVGLEKAYEILSKEFPDGTAEPYIDALSQSNETAGIEKDLISYVADKLIKEGFRAGNIN